MIKYSTLHIKLIFLNFSIFIKKPSWAHKKLKMEFLQCILYYGRITGEKMILLRNLYALDYIKLVKKYMY